MGGYIGFVYLIENLLTSKKYVGKKLLTKRGRRTKKLRKRPIVASDWPTYWGSCKELQEDVKKFGADNFRRDVLCFARSRGELSYLEVKEQVGRNVLYSNGYYNNFIGCKIHRKHLK